MAVPKKKTSRRRRDMRRAHDAIKFKLLVKRLRRVHRILPGHRINDKQNVLWHQSGIHTTKLTHQIIIDMQTARRIKDQHI